MKPIFVRPAMAKDSQDFLDWSLAAKDSGFDPDVPNYPTSVTFAAYNEDGPIAYLPMQAPIVLESLAAKPDATPLEIASALRDFVKTAILQCHIRGIGEIMFIGTSPETNLFAENSKIFTKVEYPVYRLKISKLEKKTK